MGRRRQRGVKAKVARARIDRAKAEQRSEVLVKSEP